MKFKSFFENVNGSFSSQFILFIYNNEDEIQNIFEFLQYNTKDRDIGYLLEEYSKLNKEQRSKILNFFTIIKKQKFTTAKINIRNNDKDNIYFLCGIELSYKNIWIDYNIIDNSASYLLGDNNIIKIDSINDLEQDVFNVMKESEIEEIKIK